MSQAVSDAEVDFVNYLNIAFMVAAVAISAHLPLETFLWAYAFLGPLHYVTEISWLHDRQYFSYSSRAVWLLVVATAAVAAVSLFKLNPKTALVALSFAVALAGAIALFRSGARQLVCALVGGGALVALAASLSPVHVVLMLFLPTIIHVYLFTGLFIVFGALKGRSASGILSAIVFIACPLVCLFGVETPPSYVTSGEMVAALDPFLPVIDILLRWLGVMADEDGVLAMLRLFGFAYSYHYLNWFSKTRIINWHRTSRARLVLIGVVYVGAVSLYLYDAKIGFKALLFLSLLHVILELPLNFRSVVGILREARGWLLRG